ncbi:MAG TPA: winged helix-turn-helix domain-containing protein [Blastocatellia bacterium]|nr:winged helix-turn-helix domain-containing protein [Blastocatellia bacterium]
MLNSLEPALMYEFGPFRLDIEKRLLLRDGEAIHLSPKAFDTLHVLVENRGRVVGKDELLNQVWPDSFVEEINLTVYISMLRKTLGDKPNEHQYIVTVPRRGYSFVADVIPLLDKNDSLMDDSLQAESEPAPSQLHVEESNEARKITEQVTTQKSVKVFSALVGFLTRPDVAPYKFMGLLSLLGIAIALSWFLIFAKPAKERSIAVLPFKLLGAHDEDHLELGMADALITRLGRLEKIRVRPSSAIFSYAGKDYDPVAAGRELGVDAVMQGTIQQIDYRIRVNVQLIKVADGKSLLSDRFDEERVNIFSVQDSISEQVAQALAVKLNDAEIKQLANRRTESTEAHEAYSRGIYFWNRRSSEGLKKSIEYFQHAIDKDPNYALAYAGMADSWAMLAINSSDNQAVGEYFENAKAAATKAIEIDETVGEAHTTMALIKSDYENDSFASEKEHKRGLELNPNYPTAHQRYAWFLLMRGQLDRAAQEMQQAVELDPLSLINNMAWASLLSYQGEPDKAIDICLKTMEIAPPEFDTPVYLLAVLYEQKRQHEQAIAQIRKYGENNKQDPLFYGTLGHIYGGCGRITEARDAIRELEKLEKKNSMAIYCIALVYAGMCDKDQAFAWMYKGARAGAMRRNLSFRYDPRFAVLREDPRFETFQRLRMEALTKRR